MNISTIYNPKIHDVTYSDLISGKGKSSISYKMVNNKRIPYWIINNKGYDNVINMIKEAINNNHDKITISYIFSISPSTCNTFIKTHIPEYYEKFIQNFKINSVIRRSKSMVGVSKSTKGKTYKEIYGTKKPSCGFKTGKLNPNFSRPKFIGCKFENSIGEKFRSKYEVKFSEILIKNNIPYDYESHYKLLNGKVKIVDFVINDILVEVTGYAYPDWRNDFDCKIQLLTKTYPNKKIVIISRNFGKYDIIDMLSKHVSSNIDVIDLDKSDDIINRFKL